MVRACPHADELEECYVKAPDERFSLKPEQLSEFQPGYTLLRLKRNLDGRRTAGAAWRDLFEAKVLELSGYEFKRCVHDPCLFVCEKETAIVHHVDDFRVYGENVHIGHSIWHEATLHSEGW